MFSIVATRFAVPLSFASRRHSIPALQCPVWRHICDKALLKLEDYEEERKKASLRLKNKDDFWLRVLTLQDSGHVFHEDLKMVWMLAEEEHLPLAKNLTEKYLKDQKQVSFGTFRFGSVVMRTCHFLGKPEFALEIFNDCLFWNWMNESMSIVVLMDLLIEKDNAQGAVDVYEKVRIMEWYAVIKNPIISMLYAIALYKMETKEALEKAEEFSKKVIISMPFRGKIQNIVGALSLKLKNPKLALSLVSEYAPRCEIAWNMKIQAHIMLSDLESVVKEIKLRRRNCLFEDTKKLVTSLDINEDMILHLNTEKHNRSLDEVITTITYKENKEATPLRKR